MVDQVQEVVDQVQGVVDQVQLEVVDLIDQVDQVQVEHLVVQVSGGGLNQKYRNFGIFGSVGCRNSKHF